MGGTAADAADRCWFTSDNPRGEPAQEIIVEMLAGVVADRLGRVTQEPDRRTAIHDAISAARACDIVLVAGKGHEDYQEISGDRLAFDDRKVAADALQKAAGAS
jgi:UDP-N-acetylmuramyl tripeptide synthase